MAAGSESYVFGRFRLEIAERQLLQDGAPVTLAPKVFDTLVLLVRRHGHLVTKDVFMQEVWPDTFVADVTLAHNISVLRRVLGHSDEMPVIETVAKKGYRFVVPVLSNTETAEPKTAAPGTPGGSSGEAEATAVDSIVRPRRRLRPTMAAAALALSAGAVVVYYVADWSALGSSPVQSIVVLPLDNLSAESGHDYLTDGLTEGLTTELAKIGALRVLSRTTADHYKKSDKPAAQIARELGVDAIVEGSVSRVGDRVRVTAQLIQSNPEQHLWAETYDRDMTDVLTLQSDIAQAVAQAIRVRLTADDRARLGRGRPSRTDAYEAYLRGRYYESGAGGLAAERAIASYEKAVALDPKFSAARAALSRVYIFGRRMQPKLALATARDIARQGLEMDPASPEAMLASAITRLYYDHDLAGAEQSFRRAIDGDPGNPDAHFYHSQCLVAMGRFDEALSAARRAADLDPLSPLISHYIGRIHYFARQYDAALSALQQALELNYNYAFTHIFFVTTYERLRRYDEALYHRQKYWTLINRPPDQVAELGRLARESGYHAALRRWAEGGVSNVERVGYMTSTELTHIYAEIGDLDEAIRWLERAVDDHVRDLIYVDVEPGFDPLRGDSRFRALLARITSSSGPDSTR